MRLEIIIEKKDKYFLIEPENNGSQLIDPRAQILYLWTCVNQTPFT